MGDYIFTDATSGDKVGVESKPKPKPKPNPKPNPNP